MCVSRTSNVLYPFYNSLLSCYTIAEIGGFLMASMEDLKKRLNSSSQFLQSNDMHVVEVKEGYAKVEMIID